MGRADLRALVVNYLIGTEESIDRVVTRLLTEKPKVAARALFEALDSVYQEAYQFRIFMLFERLTRDDSGQWRRLVEKSISKPGRAPKAVRTVIRSALAGTPAAPAAPPIRKPRTPVGTRKGRHALDISVGHTSISGYHSLVNQLVNLQPVKGDVIELNCESLPHVYVFGLAILASFLRLYSLEIVVTNTNASTTEYLERIGFLRVLEGEDPDPFFDEGSGWAVKLTPVLSSTEAEAVAGRLVEVFDYHLGLSNEHKDALYIVMSETVENIIRHAEIRSPAYVCAQVYPMRKKLSIAIVDSGIGVRESFLTGDNLYAQKRILDQGDRPLDLAVERLQTSKTQNHAGYGLFVVKELILQNGGTFRLTSDETSITHYVKNQRKKKRVDKHRRWKGTALAMLFDLNRQLGLDQVWRLLPTPRGYMTEDFFD